MQSKFHFARSESSALQLPPHAMIAPCLIASFSTILLLNPLALAADTEENCIVLRQHDYKLGEVTIYLGDKHVRVNCMNGKCSIVAAAPDWNVVVFNKDKQYVAVDRADWHESGLKGVTRSIRQFFDIKKQTLVKINHMGHASIQSSRSVRGKLADSFDIAFRSNPKRNLTAAKRKVTYIASSDFRLNKEIAEFVEGFYLTAQNARVLLSTISESAGDKTSSFNTHSIEQKKFPTSFFKVPGGLKKAYSISAVAAGLDVEGVLMEVVGGDHP